MEADIAVEDKRISKSDLEAMKFIRISIF